MDYYDAFIIIHAELLIKTVNIVVTLTIKAKSAVYIVGLSKNDMWTGQLMMKQKYQILRASSSLCQKILNIQNLGRLVTL